MIMHGTGQQTRQPVQLLRRYRLDISGHQASDLAEEFAAADLLTSGTETDCVLWLLLLAYSFTYFFT